MTTVAVRGGSVALKSIGDQELALLRWVAEKRAASVGEVAEGFGAPRGLARSTVLTMMERLRAKRYLERRRTDGVFRYAAKASPSELLQGAVASFVEKTLAGSVSPVVTYLAEREEVSDDELAELERLVEKLQSSRRREP
jgi:predicted transcriptional regulator